MNNFISKITLGISLSVFLAASPLVNAYVELQLNHQNEFYVFRNPADIGFGAVLLSLLPVLDRYDKGKYAGVKIDLDTGCYLEPDLGPNWWNYFFEPVEVGNLAAKRYRFTIDQILAFYQIGARIPRARTQELLERYVHLKPEIQEEIDEYVERNFQGHFVIGVHHRGTDKKSEVNLIPYSKTFQVLKQAIAKVPAEKLESLRIFVATDDQAFLKYLSGIYRDKVIHNDFVRSNNGEPLHYSKNKYGNNYQKGKEAIIDCFMLARCDWLIYPTASSFSLFSTKINAKLPVKPIKPPLGITINEFRGL